MRKQLSLLLLLGLGSYFPFREGQASANEKQVYAMLAACRFTIRQIEPQDKGSDRWLVTIAGREPDGAEKAKCLEREQEKLGVSITVFGPPSVNR